MSDLKKIIDYLKISADSIKSTSNPMQIVDLNFTEEKDNFDVNKTVTKNELNIESQYYKLSNHIIINQLHLQPQPNGDIFYFESKDLNVNGVNVIKYRRIPLYISDQWIDLDANTLTTIDTPTSFQYYYDKYLEKIIFVIEELDSVVVIPDYKNYHPDDIAAEDEEVCSFDYLDHQGYTKSFSDLFLRVLLENSIELYANESKRNIIIYKKPDGGKISILPKITKSFGDYFLKYNYLEKGIRFNSFMAERAVKLEFNYFGALLEFLNQTIFNYYDELDYFNSNNKALFFEDYTSLVNHLLKKYRGKQKLEVLYYIPIFVFQKIKPKFLWDTLDEILEGMVTNLGLNVEDITIKILEGLSKNHENKDDFIKELLVSYDKKETRFSILYSKLNGENFKKFVNLIHRVWFNSSYKNPDNKLYKNNESPFVVNYEAKKEFTFFYSNMNISWINANLLKYEPDTSWWDEIASILHPAIGEAVKHFTETEKSFYYHPFQPIAVNNFQKQQTGVALTSPLFPAFVLKAGEDVAFWENTATAAEYTVDIITTFSGVGNIAKFRHLAKVASKANKLKFISRTGKVVANAKTAARGAVGVIEISSGTVNTLLKITDQRDEPWAKEVSEFLLILELCSLGADLGEFLLKRARTSAKNALEYEDEIRKQLDEVVIEDGNSTRKLTETDKTKFFEELKKVADNTINQTPEQMWKDFTYQNLLDGKKPCFLDGTLVKTEKGLIAIEKIEVGTKVLSYNFETQKTEYQPVLQTFSNFAEKYVEIYTETEVLKVTGAHLFYVPKEKKWLAASQLKVEMHLVDDNQNIALIKKLNIIKAEVPTYNLEVTENHNYYVGKNQHILTHNDGKKLKFTSEVLMDFEFYEFFDYQNNPLYIGQTTQGVPKRVDQHTQDFEKNSNKKEFMKYQEGNKTLRINGEKGPFKMTPFEAAVTEMYELQTRGGKQMNGKGLFNKKNPVSKRTFERIKNKYPNFNPCRFYY